MNKDSKSKRYRRTQNTKYIQNRIPFRPTSHVTNKLLKIWNWWSCAVSKNLFGSQDTEKFSKKTSRIFVANKSRRKYQPLRRLKWKSYISILIHSINNNDHCRDLAKRMDWKKRFCKMLFSFTASHSFKFFLIGILKKIKYMLQNLQQFLNWEISLSKNALKYLIIFFLLLISLFTVVIIMSWRDKILIWK